MEKIEDHLEQEMEVKEASSLEENLSFFEKIKKSFPSVKRKASDGSNSASSEDESRRDSLQSTFSLPVGVGLTRRPSSASTFGRSAGSLVI